MQGTKVSPRTKHIAIPYHFGNNQEQNAEDSNYAGNGEQNDYPFQEDATQDACPTEQNRNLPYTRRSEPNLQNPEMSSRQNWPSAHHSI